MQTKCVSYNLLSSLDNTEVVLRENVYVLCLDHVMLRYVRMRICYVVFFNHSDRI